MRRRRTELAAHRADISEHAVGDRAHAVAVVFVDQLAADLERPRPLAELAKHVGEAGDAARLRAVLAGGLAEGESAGQRLPGPAVIARRLEHGPEPLVGVDPLRREPVLEGQAETLLDELEAGVELAPLREHHSLGSERTRLEVEPPGGARLLAREAAELERRAVAAGELKKVRRSQPVAGRRRRIAAGGECVGARRQRLDRSGAIALERADLTEPALRSANPERVARGVAQR